MAARSPIASLKALDLYLTSLESFHLTLSASNLRWHILKLTGLKEQVSQLIDSLEKANSITAPTDEKVKLLNLILDDRKMNQMINDLNWAYSLGSSSKFVTR